MAKVSFLSKTLARLFPGYALRREIAIRRLNRLEKADKIFKRSFEAVSGDRTRYDFLSTNKSPDAAIKGDIAALREHVRQYEYNTGFISGPIRRVVSHVVGKGFMLKANVQADRSGIVPKINSSMAENFNNQIEYQFKRWEKQSDVRLIEHFSDQVCTIVGALIRDGELIAVGRNSKRSGRIIPYCLNLYEADRLQTPAEEIQNPSIRNGIEFDSEGVPKNYFILKNHPGDDLTNIRNITDFEIIPAFNVNGTKKVMHLFNPFRRPEQTRGFSEFASALKDIQDLERYREAELLAALEDACLTGFVKTPNPTGFNAAYTGSSGSDEDGYERIHDFSPNTFHYLKPGEEIDIHAPKRPNDAYGEFTEQLIRGPANAIDTPPEIITQNWKGMNYSNARTVMIWFWASCFMRQNYLIDHFMNYVYDNVVRWFVIKGLIQAPNFDRRSDAYLACEWIPQVYRKWVDPQKEATGKKIDLETNMDNLTDSLAERGKDVETHLRTKAKELKLIQDLEKEFGVKFAISKESKPEDITNDDDQGEQNDGNKSKIIQIQR